MFQAVQAQENKRRKRRIMKIAVYVMFGIIAMGVFAIWLFHKDAINSIRFGNHFIFSVKVCFFFDSLKKFSLNHRQKKF